MFYSFHPYLWKMLSFKTLMALSANSFVLLPRVRRPVHRQIAQSLRWAKTAVKWSRYSWCLSTTGSWRTWWKEASSSSGDMAYTSFLKISSSHCRSPFGTCDENISSVFIHTSKTVYLTPSSKKICRENSKRF